MGMLRLEVGLMQHVDLAICPFRMRWNLLTCRAISDGARGRSIHNAIVVL